MSTVAAEQSLARPVEERGVALLSIAEDQWYDRKSSRVSARDLADAMIGFANAEGGIIVIGLRNDTVEGVSGAQSKRLAEWQQASLDFTRPAVPNRVRTIECLNSRGNDDQLVVVEVETSTQVHSNRKDEVFLRVGDETRRLTFAQRQELLYDKGQSTFETTIVPDAEFPDLDQTLLRSYADAVKHPDPKRLLIARGLATPGGELTAGAVLLFANHPQRWFPEANLRVLRYRGTERGSGARQQLLHDRRIDGSIPQQLLDAREDVLDQIPTRRALGHSGRFEKIGLIPQDAWLEAIVNAVIHRSYSSSGDHIRVEIFDDRIEVESPGRFPGIAETSDPFNITRFARNPRIARVCADLAFGQELGEGIRRMYEEMRLAGLADPEYHQTSGSVRLTLPSAAVDSELEARLPPGSRDLVRFIREGERLSTGEIAVASGRSRPVVIRQLKALQDAGVIRWFGNSARDPRAYWTIITE